MTLNYSWPISNYCLPVHIFSTKSLLKPPLGALYNECLFHSFDLVDTPFPVEITRITVHHLNRPRAPIINIHTPTARYSLRFLPRIARGTTRTPPKPRCVLDPCPTRSIRRRSSARHHPPDSRDVNRSRRQLQGLRSSFPLFSSDQMPRQSPDVSVGRQTGPRVRESGGVGTAGNAAGFVIVVGVPRPSNQSDPVGPVRFS